MCRKRLFNANSTNLFTRYTQEKINVDFFYINKKMSAKNRNKNTILKNGIKVCAIAVIHILSPARIVN